MSNITPTRYKQAVDGYKKSDDFAKAANPQTIGAAESQRKYLENRILAAFRAGWEAKERAEIFDANAREVK